MTGGTHDPVALRVQRLDLQLQTLVLGQLAASRSEGGAFPQRPSRSYSTTSAPRPGQDRERLHGPDDEEVVRKATAAGAYKVTPAGKAKVRAQ